MRNPKIYLFLVLFCTSFWTCSIAEEVLSFSNKDYKTRYYALLEELRCLVCQNQNLADSGAGLAEDLKKEVFTMVESGKSDAEIKSFLTLRYGDFILYKPPFTLRTLFLWLGPFILLLGAFSFLIFHIKQRQKNHNKNPALNNDEKDTLARLLAKEEDA